MSPLTDDTLWGNLERNRTYCRKGWTVDTPSKNSTIWGFIRGCCAKAIETIVVGAILAVLGLIVVLPRIFVPLQDAVTVPLWLVILPPIVVAEITLVAVYVPKWIARRRFKDKDKEYCIRWLLTADVTPYHDDRSTADIPTPAPWKLIFKALAPRLQVRASVKGLKEALEEFVLGYSSNFRNEHDRLRHTLLPESRPTAEISDGVLREVIAKLQSSGLISRENYVWKLTSFGERMMTKLFNPDGKE